MMTTIDANEFDILMNVRNQLRMQKWLTPKDGEPCFRIAMEFLDREYRRSGWL